MSSNNHSTRSCSRFELFLYISDSLEHYKSFLREFAIHENILNINIMNIFSFYKSVFGNGFLFLLDKLLAKLIHKFRFREVRL